MAEHAAVADETIGFEQGRVYNYYYPMKKKARTPRHHDRRFWFVQAVPGDGVTHYLFKSIAGGYIISFTERDFMSGDVRMM